MARYTVTCDTCGSGMDFTTFGGNSRDRQWRADHFTHECDKCKQERIEKENEENALKNQDNGLPTLVGTEKQVAWAETIRASFVEKADKLMDSVGNFPKTFKELKEKNPDKSEARTIKKSLRDLDLYYTFDDSMFVVENSTKTINYKVNKLFEKTSASFWIDNRRSEIGFLVEDIPDESETIREDLERKLQKEAEIESTTRPEEALTETIAVVAVEDEKKITISFSEKRDDFITLVKSKGFSWGNGRWYRKTSFITGDTKERVAEIGNLLLSNGFIIRLFDEEIKQRAIEGIYEPEHTRWIQEYKGKFSIRWKRHFEDFYEEARKIPTSKWDNPTVDVKSEQFEAVLDFANEYDFRFTPKAQELLEEAKRAKEAQLVPQVKKGKESTKAIPKERDFTKMEAEVDTSMLD